MYTYKDFVTGKIRHTRGKFDGWTKPTGLLKVTYAVFNNPRGVVLVPRYLLTPETKATLSQFIKVKHISGSRNMVVNLAEIEITHPVPSYDAYWYRGERIVLTDDQKHLIKEYQSNSSTAR